MVNKKQKKGLSKAEYRQQKLYELKKKSPAVAVGLSLLIIGSGSIYAGKVASGILQMLASLILWMFLLGWIVWFVSPIIAYFDVVKHNETLKLELDLDD